MKIKTLLAAAIATATLSAMASPAFAAHCTETLAATHGTTTRAEVRADFQVYRESGLAAADRDEDSGLENELQRDQARARYEALKASPRYAALVKRYGKQDSQLAARETVAGH